MLTDKNDLEELLELAQETRSLPKNRYDYGKPSIDNYVRMNKFKHTGDKAFLNRIPFSLLLMDYKQWMTTNYPEILIETDYNFYREAPDFFNLYTFKGMRYLLIIVPKRFRDYDHLHNDEYHEHMKKLWRAKKRKSSGQKKAFRTKTWNE